MTLSIDNINKPSNKKLKKIADCLLYTALPAINAFFIYLEAKQIVATGFALWGVAISNLLIALFKGSVKLTAEEEITQTVQP